MCKSQRKLESARVTFPAALEYLGPILACILRVAQALELLVGGGVALVGVGGNLYKLVSAPTSASSSQPPKYWLLQGTSGGV